MACVADFLSLCLQQSAITLISGFFSFECRTLPYNGAIENWQGILGETHFVYLSRLSNA